MLDRPVSVTRSDGTTSGTSYTTTTSIAWPAVTVTDSNGVAWTRHASGLGNVEYTAPPLGATATASPSQGGGDYHGRSVLAETTSETVASSTFLDQSGRRVADLRRPQRLRDRAARRRG